MSTKATAAAMGTALFAGLAIPAMSSISPIAGLTPMMKAAFAADLLPAPPKPPHAKPSEPKGWQAPTIRPLAADRLAAAIPPPPQAYTWGSGSRSTLVLYDTTNTYGWLGELYAMAAGNLATHFGTVTAEPVVDYEAGQVSQYKAVIYIGSTYDEPIPAAFTSDVMSSTVPVIWMGDNVWELSGPSNSATATAFDNEYGWDASTSYFDSSDTIPSVAYNGQTLNRNPDSGSVLAPHITNQSSVTVLGEANCATGTTTGTGVTATTTYAPVACNALAQAPGGPTATQFPWAIRSGNLTYIGEVPFSYISESDRYLAFSDLLFDALAPSAPPVHEAMVRLEDVSPGIDTPAELEADANYLYSQHIPFSIGVIPQYIDAKGTYTGGVPVTENISQTSNPTIAAFDAAIRYMVSKGGTVIEHGDTHQYSNVDNPYDAVTGDDFEFYAAQCSPDQGVLPAGTTTLFGTSCPNTDWVVEEGPLPGDSQSGAQAKAVQGRSFFAGAGLPTPTIWETPHYAASAADYNGIDQVFKVRYERDLFFGGQITPGASINDSHVFGQFFPYTVTDAYGETVLPEDLGNYEPSWDNNNPPKPPSYLIGNAKAELAVRQGVASFFFHPYYDVAYLQQTIQGIQALGYTFVSSPSQIPGAPLSVATQSLPAATVGQPYSWQLAATGGSGNVTWSLKSGSLPAGLTLSSTTGMISGTPTTAGYSPVSVQATDGTGASASQTLGLQVNATALTISNNPLPDATVGQPYTATLSATGGVGKYQWWVASGSLPTGLSLNSSTGVISGTPTSSTDPSVTILVTDSNRPVDLAVQTFGVTVNPANLAIATTTLPAGSVGRPYNATLSATGGVGTDTWSISSGTLPAGLSLNPTTGAITGTPTATTTGTPVTFTVHDSYPQGADTATQALTVVVNKSGPGSGDGPGSGSGPGSGGGPGPSGGPFDAGGILQFLGNLIDPLLQQFGL